MSELLTVLNDMEKGVYERTMVSTQPSESTEDGTGRKIRKERRMGEGRGEGERSLSLTNLYNVMLLMFFFLLDRHPSVPLVPGGGEVIEMDHVIKLVPAILLITTFKSLPPLHAALRGYHWLPPMVMYW